MLASVAFISAGIILLAAAVLRGELTFALFVVFPVFFGTGPFALFGIMSLFAGIFLLFFAFATRSDESAPPHANEAKPFQPPREEPRARAGGVILIGPIPIVFGTDAGMTKAMLILAIILTAIMALAFIAFLFLGMR